MLRCGLPFLPPYCRPRLGRAPVGFGSVRPAATGALRLPQSCTNHVPRKSLAPPPCGFGASFVGDCPHPPKSAASHSRLRLAASALRSWATAHTRQSARQVTRASALRLQRFVRGRLPTPAKVRGQSLAPLRSGLLAGQWPCAVCPDGLRFRSDYQGTRRTIGGFARQARKSPDGRPLPCSAPLRSTPLVQTPGSRKVAGESGRAYRRGLVCRLTLELQCSQELSARDSSWCRSLM